MGSRFEGQVAYITGVARGQGRSHALHLADEGADIIGIDICGEVGRTADFYPAATEDDLAETVRLVEAKGRRIIVDQVDVRDYAAVASSLDAAVERMGRLDVVVGNAGIFQFGDQIDATSVDDWRDVIDVNLNGVFHTCKAAIPHLLAGGRGGSVVLIASGAGIQGMPNFGHYVAAKHGLIGLMRTMALEVGPHGIRVNVIAPANCDTQMIQNEPMYRLFLPENEKPTREDFAPASAEHLVLPTPWVEPVDISKAVMFLASDDARYITGVTLPVDAGMTIK